MLTERWTYSTKRGLTQWYGHVDYYGPFVIGQCFALDADTGRELWSKRCGRRNTIRGYYDGIIVASETCNDGPSTFGSGIYGIEAKTGKLLWVSHGRGVWNHLLIWCDYLPGFSNDLRDTPDKVFNDLILTTKGRVLSIYTGKEIRSIDKAVFTSEPSPDLPYELHMKRTLPLDDNVLKVDGHGDAFSISSLTNEGNEAWRFTAKELASHVNGNYYSFRLHHNTIYIILSDAPQYIPVHPSNPGLVKPNQANYQIAALDIHTGKYTLTPLTYAEKRTECRIEAIRGSRMLVSCDGTILTEYEIADFPGNV